MTIAEYCDTINADLVITRYCNQNERWSAHFSHCEVKDGSMLGSISGESNTPYGAVNAYFKRIMSEIIVFNEMSEMRREFTVPTSIELYKQEELNATRTEGK